MNRYVIEDLTCAVLFMGNLSINYWNLIKIIIVIFKKIDIFWVGVSFRRTLIFRVTMFLPAVHRPLADKFEMRNMNKICIRVQMKARRSWIRTSSIHPSIHPYIYIYIHTHTYIHTYIYIYISTYIHTYIYPSIHPSIHIYIHTYTHIHPYIHTYTYIRTYIYIDTYIHTYKIHIYIHTHTYTYTHAYTHTHTYVHIYTYIPTYLPTYLPTYIHTYIHAYIPTYIHTGGQPAFQKPLSSNSWGDSKLVNLSKSRHCYFHDHEVPHIGLLIIISKEFSLYTRIF
jgi:hypothetical protein